MDEGLKALPSSASLESKIVVNLTEDYSCNETADNKVEINNVPVKTECDVAAADSENISNGEAEDCGFQTDETFVKTEYVDDFMENSDAYEPFYMKKQSETNRSNHFVNEKSDCCVSARLSEETTYTLVKSESTVSDDAMEECAQGLTLDRVSVTPEDEISAGKVKNFDDHMPFKSHSCDSVFDSDQNETVFIQLLSKRLLCHGKAKPYECDECPVTFAKASHLKQHQRIHTGEKPFKCTECGTAFGRSGGLKEHMKSHTGEKPFECAWCDAAFARADGLKEHMKSHTGEKPFKCTWCNSAFAQSGNLKEHNRTHTGERPFKCTQCDAAFAVSSNLKRHERSRHTGEKPFKCAQCEAAFARSSILKSHLRRHTGERPFKCTQCDIAFAQSGSLRQHIRTHIGEKPFKCAWCDSAFARSGNLRRHERGHTGRKTFQVHTV